MDSVSAPHPALEAVFAAFDREGARWVVLRGDVTLGDPDADVDVLVDPADVVRVRPLLEDLGFAEVPGRGYGTHRFFMSHHQPSDRWVKLDVLTELAFGGDFGLSTGAEHACLDRRRRLGPVAVLDEADAFWAVLLHLLLDRGTATGSRTLLAQRLAGRISGESPLSAVVDAACPPGWSPARFIQSARGGDWDALREVAPALAARWRRRQGLAGVRRRARLHLRRAGDRLLRLSCRPPIWTAYVKRGAVS